MLKTINQQQLKLPKSANYLQEVVSGATVKSVLLLIKLPLWPSSAVNWAIFGAMISDRKENFSQDNVRQLFKDYQ